MDNGVKVRMSGYLHLKTKKRMISSWRNYWFVLEDRLLLYYRSKAEYETISPCKGSINLGPPCMVKSLPSVANSFQVETRSLTYTLKADNSDDQKKWMQAILAVLNQNQNFPTESPKRLSHFRYSLDELFPQVEPNDPQTPLERQNTLPHRLKLEPKKSSEIIQRLQKLGAQSYGGSLGAISKIATKKVGKEEEKAKNASQGSLPSCLFNEADEEEVRPQKEENIYERISGESQYSEGSEKYSVPLRRGLSVSEERDKGAPARETKSLLVENDQYASTRHVQSDEVVYAEPKITPIIDCNKNSLLVENTFYARSDILGHTNDNIYEDLDEYNPYSEPVLKSSSQGSVEDKQKEKIKKTKSFIRRVWKKKHRKQDEKKVEEEIYAEVDTTSVNKVEMGDGSAIQMLSELHNILENKKAQLRAKASNDSPNEASESTTKPEEAPKLPPKTHPPEQFRSLDEILEDLDREKLESKGKVQLLIEKFSDSEPEVILRKHDKSAYRHSDDLNSLLDELAKVTSAPIMTPGVTTSLVNPNLTDEDWLKLLPVRQRRLSEPDYDIPRPLKPVQAPEKPENTDVIPVTRFFGPVLPPTITDNKDDSLCVSMTPDSLEIEKFQTLCSYTSHNYTDLKCFHKKDDVIYALPKSYLSTHIVNTCQNICGGGNLDDCQIIYKNVKHEEIFNDSLELYNETKTEFKF
ncbi:uncharacterized protein LOC123004010 [Tribolium madens]|uniref:uncharacterized protein LOC123004010 n=1 Tax=Tribolium madens TaxID=41895 RepID=UPI001CF74158|nr:uncharacterized protein LOC123004010 [Tribolium madens]XP_044253040.1 uncharacterized protein LOC123004010 [Tribolium madens]XP_044253041.1 uncharacterized protein LOC123004010 [Tribolium madens]